MTFDSDLPESLNDCDVDWSLDILEFEFLFDFDNFSEHVFQTEKLILTVPAMVLHHGKTILVVELFHFVNTISSLSFRAVFSFHN